MRVQIDALLAEGRRQDPEGWAALDLLHVIQEWTGEVDRQGIVPTGLAQGSRRGVRLSTSSSSGYGTTRPALDLPTTRCCSTSRTTASATSPRRKPDAIDQT